MTNPQGEFTFPAHVLPELRWNHSMRSYAHELADPFLAVSRLHDGPDIFYARDMSQERPGWVLTRHAHQQEAFLDTARFSSQSASGLDKLLGSDFRLVPIDYDPPEQTAFRMIMNPFFTPAAVAAMEGPVRETCRRLIDGFANKGGCEFIGDFAAPFPSYIFLSLVGLPVDEAPKFLAWEAQLLRGETFQQRAEAGLAVFHYLHGFVQAQRARPSNALLTGIVNAQVAGRPVTDTEILGMLYTLYAGGLDTVYSTLGWILRHLARVQDLQRRLRENLALLEQAVEEFGRAYSVVSTLRRVAKDVVFHDVEMRAGDLVLLPLFLSGRDPKAWANPHEIDLTRRPRALTFANGPHVCLGRYLARREMRIALEEFLTRFDDINIPAGESYDFHTSPVFGVDRLPLEWRRSSH
jgi:cytochrome P450